MIRALVTGSLYGPPQARTSQAGKQFVTAKVKADGKDGAVVWCSVIAFGEQADRLMTLGDGAALSVSGRAEVNGWLDKQGEPKAGLSLVVDDLATLKGKPRPPQADARPGRGPCRIRVKSYHKDSDAGRRSSFSNIGSKGSGTSSMSRTY